MDWWLQGKLEVKVLVNKCCCRYYEDVGGVKLFGMVYRIKLVNKVWKIWLYKVMIGMWWIISKFWKGYD